MTSHLLHGLWIRGSGLHLWIEQVNGHRIVAPSNVPAGTFPPAADHLLEDRKFRHRLRADLRTPKGRDVELVIPTAAHAPEQAVQVLSQLAFLDDASPAATQSQRASIAPDLYWLIRMYNGLTRFIRAGRVTLKLSYEDDQWFPQWQLASGLGERGWVAEMAAAAPGILTSNNSILVEDLLKVLPHWIASAHLRGLAESTRPYPWHEFSEALLYSRPLRRGGANLLGRLNEWKDSITSVDLQLVIIIEQPPAAAEAEDPEDSSWPVRLQVRSGVDSPMPIRTRELDRGSVERLRERQRRALEITALLDPTQRPALPGIDSGDWDVALSTPEIVDFISRDVPRLKAAGFQVMLPKAWSNYETRARLETSEAGDPSTGATRSHIGLDQLVEYNWRLSVGDVELSDEEMAELVESK